MLDRNRVPYRALARGGLIACALLLTCAATSNPPAPSGGNTKAQHQPTTSHEHAEGQGPNQVAQLPVVVAQNDPPPHNQIGTEAETQRQWYAMPDWWIAGFTAALFLATALLWFATWRMWRTTRDAVKDGKDAVKAAIRSAQAAEAAIEKSDAALSHAQDTAKRQLRAYVHVDLRSDIYTRRNGWEILYSMLVVNSGQTPAYDVMVLGNICVADHPLTRSLPPVVANSEPSRASLYPGQTGVTAGIISNPALTQADFASLAPIDIGDAIKSATSRLYLYGKITYRDVFGEAHTTHFRCRTNGLQGYEAAFSWCAEGNEAE